jgi:hypothetical protein
MSALEILLVLVGAAFLLAAAAALVAVGARIYYHGTLHSQPIYIDKDGTKLKEGEEPEEDEPELSSFRPYPKG